MCLLQELQFYHFQTRIIVCYGLHVNEGGHEFLVTRYVSIWLFTQINQQITLTELKQVTNFFGSLHHPLIIFHPRITFISTNTTNI